jgi:hypothetical protein
MEYIGVDLHKQFFTHVPSPKRARARGSNGFLGMMAAWCCFARDVQQ